MKGRKPEPSALKLLRGLPGKRKLSLDEPQPALLSGAQPPEWLDEEAKVEWQRLAPILERLGVFTETDTTALTAYCEAWATWKAATQKIRQFGMVIKGKDGDLPIVSPYVKIAEKSFLQVKAMLIEFGMTPSSRARVQKQPDTTKVRSKWAGELG